MAVDKEGVRMIILKCPSCGGELRVEPGTAQARCEHCKTTVLILDPSKGTTEVDQRNASTPEEEAAARRIVKFTLFGTAISFMLPILIIVIIFVIIGLAFLALGFASFWVAK